MNQELSSVVRLFSDTLPSHELYFDEVPHSFERPSMYFQAPQIETLPMSLSAFQYSYSWYIQIFNTKSSTALEDAHALQDLITRNRKQIRLYKQDGTLDNKYTTFDTIQVRKLDEAVAQIELGWKSGYYYNREEAQKIQQFVVNTRLKI